MVFSNPTGTACPYVKHVAMYNPLFYTEPSRFLDMVIMVISAEVSVVVKKHWPLPSILIGLLHHLGVHTEGLVRNP